jgi:hypothetical protein
VPAGAAVAMACFCCFLAAQDGCSSSSCRVHVGLLGALCACLPRAGGGAALPSGAPLPRCERKGVRFNDVKRERTMRTHTEAGTYLLEFLVWFFWLALAEWLGGRLLLLENTQSERKGGEGEKRQRTMGHSLAGGLPAARAPPPRA